MKRETAVAGVILIVCLILTFAIVFGGDSSGPEDFEDHASFIDVNAESTPTVSGDTIAENTEPDDSLALHPSPTIIEPTSIAADAAVEEVKKVEYWLVGYALDEDNKPIAGARIVVHPIEEINPHIIVSGEDPVVAKSETDEKGYYAVLLNEPHAYQARSIPPEEFITVVEQFTLSDEEKTATVNFVHPQGGFKLKGKVLDQETEKPIEGANVALFKQHKNSHPKQQTEHAVSKEDGAFLIQRLAAGVFRLEAKADGYVDFNPYRDDSQSSLRRIQVNESTQDKEYVIRMEPGGSAEFHVVDSDQQPIADAFVSVKKDSELWSNAGYCTTDHSGVAVSNKLPNASLIAEVNHEEKGKGYSSIFKPGTKENPTLVNITVAKGASVSGRVTGSDGELIPGKTIFAEYLSLKGWSKPPQENKTTDENGAYLFENLTPGSYRISLSNDNWQLKPIQSHEIELEADEERTEVNFTIKGETKDLRGKVISRKDEPLEGVFVNAVMYLENGNISGTEDATTDENGEFSIKTVITGDDVQYQLQGKEGYAHTIKRVPMDGKYVIITMRYSGSISGTVVDPEGQPFSGANVFIIRDYGSFSSESRYNAITTGADGSFRFEDLDPMDYRVCAEAEGYIQTKSSKMTLVEGETIDNAVIELKRGMEVTGAVVDPSGGPVPSAVISILSYIPNVSSNRNSWGTFGEQEFSEDAVTDSAGMFRIDSFPLEGDTLVIRHDRFAPAKFSIDPSMFDQQPYTIRLTEGGAIEGKVVDGQDNPVSSVPIQVRNYPENLFRYQVRTGEDGAYRRDRLPAGSYMVIREGANDLINDSEYKTVAVEEGMTTRVDFGLGEGALVHGTVFKRGEPEPAASIVLESQNPKPDEIGTRMNTQSGANGEYSFKGVPEGAYRIMVSSNPDGMIHYSNAEYTVSIQIASGQSDCVQDLYIASLEVQGTILDAENNEPIAGVKVLPRMYHDVTRSGNSARMNAVTDNEGRFTLYPEKGGEWTLAAIKEGYRTKEFNLSIPAINPGDVAQPVRADLVLEKDESSILARLIYNGEPAVASWAQFSMRADDFSQTLVGIAQPEVGYYRILGMPEGVFDLSVRSYCNNKVLHAAAYQIALRTGETLEIDLNLYEVTRYVVFLKPSDEASLTGIATIELLGTGNYPPRTVSFGARIPNAFSMEIPKDMRYVRLTVPGYQPVEFDPTAMADTSQTEPIITLQLAK